MGAERFNLFQDCAAAKTSTMVLRGGSEQFIAEAERSLHDAIMIVRRAVKNSEVRGAGAALSLCRASVLADRRAASTRRPLTALVACRWSQEGARLTWRSHARSAPMHVT